MRYFSLAAILLTGTASFSNAATNTFAVTNYQLVSSTKASLTQVDVSYTATLVNTGPALPSVSATLVMPVPNVTLPPSPNITLTFSPVAANGPVASANFFTIRVDRTATFDVNTLQWTFQSSPPPPIANAGLDQTVSVGSLVTLNGSASSNPGGGGPLTYAWAFVSTPPGGSVAINNPTAVMPTFIPTVAGTYVVGLTVSNGSSSAFAKVNINTSPVTKPIANAGPNQSVAPGSTVTLNGGGSTSPDNKPLTFSWVLTSKPSGSAASLTGANTVSPTFVADNGGTYMAQLIVNDGTTNSDPTTVTITTTPMYGPPTAKATGPSVPVNQGDTVQLSGAGSTDLNGHPLTYQWTFLSVPSGSTATISNPTSVTASFVADVGGQYVAQLIVNDGQSPSAPAMVTISVNAAIQAPTAFAGSPQSVQAGSTVTQTGSGSDPQSLPLTFQWTLTSKPTGSGATLANANSGTTTFVADLVGSYVLQLVVNNGTKSSAPATVTITAGNPNTLGPIVNAGPPQTVGVGATVHLDGSGSSDPNGKGLTYLWTFTSTPGGSNATLTGATTVSPTFVTDQAGQYVVQLTVDNTVSKASATVTITAGPGTITVTDGNNQSTAINTPFAKPITVLVKDPGGNPVAGDPVTFTLSSLSGASAAFAGGVNTAITDASGVAVSPILTANSTTGGFTISVSAAGIALPATVSLSNTFGIPNSVTAVSGGGQSAATSTAFASPLVAVVKDASNNVLSGVAVTFTAPASGPSGTFAGGNLTATVPSDAAGVATSPVFTANSTAGGPYSVSASVAGVATTASFSLTNTQSVPASIAVSSGSPQSAVIKTAFGSPLAAIVKDLNGVPLGNVTVTFAAPGGGATGTFAGGATTALTNAAGIATSAVFTANDVAGPYSVTASVAGVGTPASFSLTNTQQVATSIAATGGTPQSAVSGTAFAAPLVATVLDASNAPVAGVTVTFAAPGSGASGTFAGGANTAITNGSGVATSAVFTANGTAGSYTVTAMVAGVATPANFSLTNTPVTAGSIAAAGGTPQTANTNAPFGSPLSALVKDTNNNPLGGVTVTFVAPASGASGFFAGSVNTATTNASGIATSAVFTANATQGSYTVTASVAGVSTPANFLLTNSAQPPPPPGSVTVAGGSGQSATINTAYASALSVLVKDTSNNPLGNATVTFSAPGSGASVTFPAGTSSVTNASGIAALGVNANGTPGTFTVTASVNGVATPASFTLTNTDGGGGGGGQLVVDSVSVGVNLQTTLNITLPAGQTAGAGGVKLTITSSDASRVTFFAGAAGNVSTFSPTISAGESSLAFFVQGNGIGSATVNVAATGFTNGSGNVTVTNSGFVLQGPNGAGASFTANVGDAVPLTVASAQLNSSNQFVTTQPLKAGLNITVGVSSTNTGTGTIAAPGSVQITGGSGEATIAFKALATGSTSLQAAVPSGFTPPANGLNTLLASVNQTQISCAPVSVGNNLEIPVSCTLSGAAPAGATLTVSTSDPKIALSNSATVTGSGSIQVNFPVSNTKTPTFFVQGLASAGTATFTANLPGFGTTTGTVTLTPSSVVIAGPAGPGVAITAGQGGAATALTIGTGQVDGGGNFLGEQQVSPGVSVSVNVTSSNTSVGTISNPTVSIAAGTGETTDQFNPGVGGTTTLSVSQPAGFVSSKGSSLTATVSSAAILAPSAMVGNNLQVPATLLLSTPAAGDVHVTLTSRDPSHLLLSNSISGAGSPSIIVTVPNGTTSNPTPFYIQAFGSSGSVTYTADATGYTPGSGSITLAPSGFILVGPFGLGLPFAFPLNNNPSSVNVQTALLDGAGNVIDPNQQLAGGLSVGVSLASSAPGVASVPAQVTVTGGTAGTPATVTPGGSGSAIVSIPTAPAGFVLSTASSVSFTN